MQVWRERSFFKTVPYLEACFPVEKIPVPWVLVSLLRKFQVIDKLVSLLRKFQVIEKIPGH